MCRTIPGCHGPARACPMRSTRLRLGSGSDRRGGSGQGRAHRGRCLDHGGQRGAAQHRAEGHGRGLPGDAGALGPGERHRDTHGRGPGAPGPKRKGKKLSNQDWVSKSDPEAKIAKMKDGTSHLAYKPEHAVDLDTGAVVAAELHPADEGDTTTLEKTLAAAKENLEAVDAAPTAEARPNV